MYIPRNRNAWRTWLEKHNQAKYSLWLVFKRKSGGARNITYAEAVEEALCVG